MAENRDIGRLSTIRELAQQVGLDSDELERGLHEGDYKWRALRAAQNSRKLGLTTTPTVILGRTASSGWHCYEVFQQVLENQGIPLKLATSSGAGAGTG